MAELRLIGHLVGPTGRVTRALVYPPGPLDMLSQSPLVNSADTL